MSEAGATDLPIKIRTVAVIGAGVAGRSFALACAQSGFHVILEDVMPANLRKAEIQFADIGQRTGTGCLTLARTIEDAVRTADVAMDFVPDELESKLEIFSLIDRMAPPTTILCTPSEALSITDLASCVYRPQRCVAVRGKLVASQAVTSSSAIRLLYPPVVNLQVLNAMQAFLMALGLRVNVEPDPDVPELMKNLVKVNC